MENYESKLVARHLEYILLGVYSFGLSQPWLIGKFMSTHTSTSTTALKESSYLYGTLIILANFFSVLVSHFYQLKIQHLGMKIRIGCCSLIYRTALKINKNAAAASNVGTIINLLSNDVNRFDLAAMHLLQLLVAPIETIVIIYFLYATVGATAVAGIVLLFLFVPFQTLTGKLTTTYRQQTASRTDQRIKLMEEILTGIQVIKMFTWEKFFARTVEQARKDEIRQIRKASFIRALNVASMLFMNRSGIFLCILSYALTQREVNATYVFVVSSFYAILRQTVTVYFPFGVQNFCETKVSVRRIREFLTTVDQRQNQITGEEPEEKKHLIVNVDAAGTVGVYLKNVSVKWQPLVHVLKSVTFEVGANDLVVITGVVGSGKSTLLYTILNEVPHSTGSVSVTGTISYSSQEPWLFSGTIRQNIIFGSKFDEHKYRTIIKICQLEKDFSALVDGDGTLVGERGSLLSGGQKSRISLARALYKDADIYLLDDPLAAVDAKVGVKIFNDCILQYLRDKCRIVVTHSSNYLVGAATKIYALDNGTLVNDFSYQKTDIARNEDVTSKNTEQLRTEPKKEKIEQRTGKVSIKVYQKYAEAGGHKIKIILLFILFAVTQTAASGADYFVAFWSDLNGRQNARSVFTLCIYVYVTIIITLVTVSIGRSIFFFQHCMKTSITLHKQMFARISKAPMLFFKTNPTGRILNRFSKDIGLMDETLPLLLMDTFQVAFIVLGSVVLVSVVNAWMLAPTAAAFLVFFVFKSIFLAKTRTIKRLEAEARSPIYNHMHASMQGLVTIRTFNVQTTLQKEFDYHQNLHSSAFYLFMTCNRAFGFWLDMSCVFYTIVVITATMLTDTSAADAGLSITQSINLIGVLQWGIRQWSELENQMITVERVLDYTKVAQEPDSRTRDNFQNWPNNGEIKFQSVSLTYFDKQCPSLDNVNFLIKSKEKIGIVGRTGAGKSSLVSSLFRLYDTHGTILIDNTDVRTVPLDTLRARISIIPQDPILFTGSLRTNIDPYHEFDDSTIWKILEQVELKNAVLELPQHLDTEILQGGSNFSVGQKQLMCLARAILRKNKIIVMDEATANVDSKTERSIHQTIEENFQDCTIITVAHRLSSILKSDRVLVMDDGKVVESDRPDCLMQNSESLFSQLLRENQRTVMYTHAI
ncbi:ATP-binding cassette sub-family C member 4-like isoform X2 [Zophobas morio]|uniref:ATP-binding cassette sub-family C member 4-like isoform X2 n=1 Tax=Zophobas morio TaxID=2755281 RepID=UPI0030835497